MREGDIVEGKTDKLYHYATVEREKKSRERERESERDKRKVTVCEGL